MGAGDEKKKRIYVEGDERGYRRVEYDGMYSFKKLIDDTVGFLKKLRYDIGESTHIEADKQVKGKRSKFEWKAERFVDDYVKFNIYIFLEIVGERDVKHGNKVVQQGKVDIHLRSWFDKNYTNPLGEKMFGDNKFSETQRRLYDKFIITEQIDELELQLLKEGWDVIDVMKGAFIESD